jgi:hypothetical protein
METVLGMYGYLYLKLAKRLPFLLSLMFSQQNWRIGQNRFFLEARGMGEEGEMAQTMYAHMNK